MSALIPICLADFFATNGIAFLACALVAYLYWSGWRERRRQRRERKWLEDRRRELKEKQARQVEPPRKL